MYIPSDLQVTLGMATAMDRIQKEIQASGFVHPDRLIPACDPPSINGRMLRTMAQVAILLLRLPLQVRK